MATKIVTVSQLKAHLASLVAQLEAEGVPIYVTQHGKPKAVLVQYGEYESLLEKLEDLEDVLAIHQSLSTPEDEAVSLDEYEQRRASRIRR